MFFEKVLAQHQVEKTPSLHTFVTVNEKAEPIIQIDLNEQVLTVNNQNQCDYLIKIYNSQGLIVLYENISQLQFEFSFKNLDVDKYYYLIKTQENHILKGTLTTLPINHIASL